MATRRPSVPKAQFTTGIGRAPDQISQEPAAAGTTPEPGTSDSPTPVGGKSGGAKAGRGKSGKGKPGQVRQRQRASGPNSRSHKDGVVQGSSNSPVPARSFSGRLLVLGLTMGVVTLLLAPNVHTFMQQRAEISALRVDIAAKQTQQSAYETELTRWDDPAYIKQQARDRVSMLMPGETGYWVYGANGVEALDDSGDPAKAVSAQETTAKDATNTTVEPWVGSLWDAVQKSAEVQPPPKAPEKAAPAPAVEPVPSSVEEIAPAQAPAP